MYEINKPQNTCWAHHTCIYILTNVNNTWCFADTSSCYVENSIKDIGVSVMHAHSTMQKDYILDYVLRQNNIQIGK